MPLTSSSRKGGQPPVAGILPPGGTRQVLLLLDDQHYWTNAQGCRPVGWGRANGGPGSKGGCTHANCALALGHLV